MDFDCKFIIKSVVIRESFVHIYHFINVIIIVLAFFNLIKWRVVNFVVIDKDTD